MYVLLAECLCRLSKVSIAYCVVLLLLVEGFSCMWMFLLLVEPFSCLLNVLALLKRFDCLCGACTASFLRHFECVVTGPLAPTEQTIERPVRLGGKV